MKTFSEKINEVLAKYKGDKKLFHETLDELYAKGVSQGCYQNYPLLFDIMLILFICENEL